jgi:hypothetical protein
LEKDEDDWKNNRYIVSFFNFASAGVCTLSDVLLPHFESNLVDDRDRETFLSTLDAEYERGERPGGEANWFAGQQVDVDITGKVSNTWSTRRDHGYRFAEL